MHSHPLVFIYLPGKKTPHTGKRPVNMPNNIGPSYHNGKYSDTPKNHTFLIMIQVDNTL